MAESSITVRNLVFSYRLIGIEMQAIYLLPLVWFPAYSAMLIIDSNGCKSNECYLMGSKIPEIPAYFCCGMKPTEISKFLQSVLEQENERAAQGIELHIDQLKWRSQEIAMVTGWLELCPPIKVLRITHSFVHLERNAFLAKPFEQTEELELFNLGIQALQKGVFHGLGNLKILRMVGMEIKFIHPDVLQPCPGLNIVYLIKCINVKDFPNKMKLFAGKQSLDELNIVEMTNNRLEDMLDDNIFSSFVVIRAIFLAYNAITSIGPGTFAMHLATLKYLDLSHNNLKTLPSDFYGVFTTFGFLINLESNQWRCDCQLQELRELIVEKTYLFENLTIYCDDQQLIMEMPNLCLNESTTIKPFKPSEMFVTFGPFLPAPTTLPNFEATDPEKKTDTVDPQWGSGLDVNTAIIYCTTERSYNQPVAMRRKTSSLIVGRDVDGKYFLNVPKFSSGSIVIGFEDSNRENVRELSMISTCHTNKRKRNQDEVQFSLKLQPNKVHRFCLTKKSFALFSPFDCIAFYSHTNATNIPTNAWIMREDRRKVILICAIFGIFSIFIGIVLIYFILKLRLKLRKSKSERIRMQINSKMEHIRNHSYDSSARSSQLKVHQDCVRVREREPEVSYINPAHQDYIDYEQSYITIGQIKTSEPLLQKLAPALPTRNRNMSKRKLTKSQCCDSDVCECYCDLIE